MKKFALSILLTLILSSQPAFAETSLDYALMGSRAWSAFECTALASLAEKYEAEQNRLFTLGYDTGIAFLQAWKEGKINKENLSNQVPVYFLLLARGTNNDFILGRVYQFIVNKVYDDMGKIAKSDLDLKKTLASDKFLENNCKLIE